MNVQNTEDLAGIFLHVFRFERAYTHAKMYLYVFLFERAYTHTKMYREWYDRL